MEQYLTLFTATFMATLMLTAVQPVSVAALYGLIKRHVQLAPEARMASAAVGRFDSEAERAAYHADFEAARQARRRAALVLYRKVLEEELKAMDPREAKAWREAALPAIEVHRG